MRYFFISFIFCFSGFLHAQDYQFFTVDTIRFTGLKRTRDKVVQRELSIASGDRLPAATIQERIDWNTYQLLNTGLFADVRSVSTLVDSFLILDFQMEEAYPLLPAVLVEFADRNFNVWWDEFNKDLRRINFGISVTHKNLTGSSDNFKVALQSGFTPEFFLEYSLPQVGKNKILGLVTSFLYSTNKELGYKTENNRLLFERNEDSYLITRLRLGTGIRIRPRFRQTHAFVLFFRDRKIAAEVVRDYNPDFFSGGKTRQRFFSLVYQWTWDSRNLRAYPSAGNYFSLIAEKTGLGFFNDVNLASASSEFRQYFSLKRHLIYEFRIKVKAGLIRQKPAYYNYRGLGYGDDYLRGYEYYVIDGFDYFFWKQSLHIPLFRYRIKSEKILSFFSTPSIPFRFYLALNADTGIVHSPFYNDSNFLVNRWLTGAGIGLNILMFYDRLLKLEYTLNTFGEKGLFLHYRIGF